MNEESRRRVLVMSRHEATKAALRELLDEDCCEVLSEATGQETRLALDEFSLVVVDAIESWAGVDRVTASLKGLRRSQRPLLFLLVGESGKLPRKLDPRVVTVVIRDPFDQGVIKDVLQQTIRRIISVGGEDTLKRLREVGAVSTDKASTPNPGVLIVDDDRAIRELVGAVVAREGLEADTASDGMAAIERLGSHKYRVLVLDLMMPKMSGWEVIEWLKDHPQRRPRSVIVCTAADRAVLSNLDPDTVNAIFIKPFDVRELGAYIHASAQLRAPRDRRRKRIVADFS